MYRKLFQYCLLSEFHTSYLWKLYSTITVLYRGEIDQGIKVDIVTLGGFGTHANRAGTRADLRQNYLNQ
jgi:hypothetical protein